jgi:hypothetical protein
MRSRGLSDFPDPVPAQGGGFAFKVEPGLNPQSPSPQFQSAENACHKDVPPGLANLTRSHGEPNFPEPNAQGLIKFTPTGILDPSSPQFQKAQTDCEKANNGGFDVRMSR